MLLVVRLVLCANIKSSKEGKGNWVMRRILVEGQLNYALRIQLIPQLGPIRFDSCSAGLLSFFPWHFFHFVCMGARNFVHVAFRQSPPATGVGEPHIGRWIGDKDVLRCTWHQ
jgi:hypothetical protein